jgi:FtsZ-interacting cell division protein ZipA
MIPLLAQATDLPAVPAETLKWVLIILVALLFIAVAIVGLWATTRKPAPTKLEDNPPISVRKEAKRYNHDAIETRFVGLERQTAENTSEIETIWTTFRQEDQAIREKNAAQFERIARSLGRIEGRLGTTPNQD